MLIRVPCGSPRRSGRPLQSRIRDAVSSILASFPFGRATDLGADAEGAAADSLAKRCGWAEAASAAHQPVPAIFSAALAYPQSYHAMYPLDCAQAQAQRVRCCASRAEMLARIFLALPLTGPQLRREAVCALSP